MALLSTIEWTNATWNPVVGCTKVSAGCANCYAERMAKRLAAMARADHAAGRNAGKKAAYLNVINTRGRWNGRTYLDYDALTIPGSWHSGRMIFVNSMSDLFHDSVPVDFIQAVFQVMNDLPRHTFQVLTKRPDRAAALSPKLTWTTNIWLGTSIENAAVLVRASQLADSAAWTRFLSVEPLLGPIPRLPLHKIAWVIVGGESGPGARPIQAAWVRQIRDRCLKFSVPFFFKQWGGANKSATGRLLDGRTWSDMPSIDTPDFGAKSHGRLPGRRGSAYASQASHS